MTDWIVDSIVGFLRSPMWVTPVLTFIEEQSIIFDPSIPESEEYKSKHAAYRNLVGLLMNSYLEDMGLPQEQFIKACGSSNPNSSITYHQGLFEQIWAADDYEIFKRMMTQKNIELELQVLQQIQARSGVLPESMVPGPNTNLLVSYMERTEEEILEEVLRQSKEEFEASKNMSDEMQKRDEQDLQKAFTISAEEKVKLVESARIEKNLLDKAVKLSLTEQATVVAVSGAAPASNAKASSVMPTAAEVSSDSKGKGARAASAVAEAALVGKGKDASATSAVADATPVSKGKAASAATSAVAETAAVSTTSRSKSTDVSGPAVKPLDDKSALPPLKVDAKSPDRETKKANIAKNEPLKPITKKKGPVEPTMVPLAPTEATDVAAASWVKSAQAEASSSVLLTSSLRTSNIGGLSSEEVKQRAEYLRQQRDKLLAMKKQARTQNLTTFEQAQPERRPESSRAARSLMGGRGAQQQNVDEKTLAMRLALAQKLKSEVIAKGHFE
ncbi:PREDICTED: cilia- and flagella-associated protein 36-like isoform X2 [Priapulus caudatus]|uniref:Cilia- and flagella-associated protein 36 n=1 Tax=Priapulus caudatus TaxID=37621 RepID=A0ABM1EIF4_PRICU|nr:PREDICTED: cilia- and flagella-associated protein 36-like isoform X2 [Priapulus caudatus]